MAQTIEKVNYAGWPNCYRISNGTVELIVTSDVGPRIIRYGFIGGQNLFKEFKEQMGKSGEPDWQIRGGHRIWVAPEVAQEISPITYAVDNDPVKIDVTATGLVATPPLEEEAGLQKQIEVRLAASGTQVQVSHRITNRNMWAIELAPWALTVMAPGGVGLTGLPPRGTHPEVLAPTNPLIIWAFTDLGDPRWIFLNKYIGLRQDPKNKVPQKIGHFNSDTWGAYYLNGELFLKRYAAFPGKTYADMGASFEMFTNGDMLELETLGPLSRLKPGETVEHVEIWSLHRGIKIDRFDDATLDRVLKPLVE
ncbi:MAG: hypothetical protein K6T61_15340 [Bryobacteraceae bacterium]|nr:hypothetical protein [Bryobacteraceae bacterium]